MQYFIVTILFSFDANIMAREMNDNGQKITSIVHRRPHNGDLAVFNKGSQRDDKFSALLLMESLGGVVDHYAYKPQDGSLVQYDNKRIYGRMSWEYVLCAFDQLGVTNYGPAHNQLQGHDNHIYANIKKSDNMFLHFRLNKLMIIFFFLSFANVFAQDEIQYIPYDSISKIGFIDKSIEDAEIESYDIVVINSHLKDTTTLCRDVLYVDSSAVELIGSQFYFISHEKFNCV